LRRLSVEWIRTLREGEVMIATLIVAVLHFFIGSVIGLCTVALVYRVRLLRGAIFGGLVFMVTSGMAIWAYTHAFGGGPRWGDSYLWDENLRSRELILAICIVSSCGAALLAGIGRPATNVRKQFPI